MVKAIAGSASIGLLGQLICRGGNQSAIPCQFSAANQAPTVEIFVRAAWPNDQAWDEIERTALNYSELDELFQDNRPDQETA